MTIPSTSPRISYTGDGSTVAFAVPFKFFGSDELQVVERTIATGAETVLTLTTDYTVSGGDGSTGTVTAVSAPASTVQWIIRRATDRTQETDYTENDPFPAETHERALDRLAAVGQEQDEAIGRSLHLQVSAPSGIDTGLPTLVARRAIVVNADADGFELSEHDPDQAQDDAEDAAEAASNSADAAAASALAASGSADAAALSETAAEAAALLAEGYAATLNMPEPAAGGTQDFVREKADGTGWELVTPAQLLAAIGALSLAGGTLTGNLTLSGTAPTLHLNGSALGRIHLSDNSAAADSRLFQFAADDAVLVYRSLTDAIAVKHTILQMGTDGGVAFGAPSGGIPATRGHVNMTALQIKGIDVQPFLPKVILHARLSAGVPAMTYEIGVSSVTDDGTGLMTVNFDTNFTGANNYVVQVTCEHSGGSRPGLIISRAVGSVQVSSRDSDGPASDPTAYNVTIHGAQ